ncbi:MAG: hypothetical protein DRO87_12885, partial [Candidatus Thorarchaeota archaeon]
FDGDGDYIENSSNFPFIEFPLSISVWIKYDEGTGNYYRSIISKGGTFASNTNFDLGVRTHSTSTSRSIYFYWRNVDALHGGGYLVPDLGDNQWHHIVVVVNDSNGLEFFLDGVSVKNDTNTAGPTDGGYPLRIARWSGTQSTSNYFNGTIDEVQIYNRALSAEQISALYQNRTDLIVSNETSNGDVWQACITPNDKYFDGIEKCSNTLTTVSLLENGSSCTTHGQCISGYCVDGVCCDSSCGSDCESCNQGGSVGTCTYYTSGDPENDCTLGSWSCSGSGSPNSCSRTRETADCSGTGSYCGSESDNAPSGQVCSSGSYIAGTDTAYASSDTADRCTSDVPTSGFGNAEFDVFACDGNGGTGGPDVGNSSTDCGTGCCFDAGSTAECKASGTHDVNYWDFSASGFGDNGATDYCIANEVKDCFDDTDCLADYYCTGSNECRERPNVTLIAPEDAEWFNNNDSIQFNFSVIYGYSNNIDNCSLYTNISGWDINQTTQGTVSNNTVTNFDDNLTLPVGTYLWNVECIGSNGWAQTNRTINVRDPNPPTWANNDTNVTNGTTKYNDVALFSINWSDDTAVKNSIFSWNSSDSGSFTNLSSYNCGMSSYCEHEQVVTIPITKGEHYCWKFYGTDKFNNVNVTDTWCFIAGNSLPTVDLYYPGAGASITNRTPTFMWNGTDVDGDTMEYQIQINLTNISACTEANRSVGGISDENHIASPYLECLYDNLDYYDWSVRASDDSGVTYGSWATLRELRINSLIDISLPTAIIEFGQLYVAETANTSGGSPGPFVLQNDGNCRVNISTNATVLFEVNQTASSNYRFKVDNNTGEEGSFNWVDSLTAWTNMPIVSQLLSLADFNWLDATDSAEVDLEVTVPGDESSGDKDTTVYLESEFNEVY